MTIDHSAKADAVTFARQTYEKPTLRPLSFVGDTAAGLGTTLEATESSTTTPAS